MRAPWPRHVTHEDLFVERYDALIRAALAITDVGEALAEDLVHDVFVQFVLTRPDLDAIRDVDNYLFITLRNTHLAYVRRRSQQWAREDSILDHADHLAAAVAANPHAREDLQTICRYACARKSSSKAASVLLLRFFHGYTPHELSQILRVTPAMADTWVSLARREARSAAQNSVSNGTRTRPSRDSEAAEFLTTLRESIFDAREGDCLAQSEWREIYVSGNGHQLSTGRLAHLVSCRTCLDIVNDLLDIPRLQDRFPTDTLGPGSRGDGRRVVPLARGGRGHARTLRDRVNDIIQRKPSELRITANGAVIASQRVAGPLSELDLVVGGDERLAFVEVLDERGDRLLMFNLVPPPDGAGIQREAIALSGGRTLQVGVTFRDAKPEIAVSYADPEWLDHAHSPSPPLEVPILSSILGSTERERSRPFWQQPRFAFALALLVMLGLAAANPEATWAAIERLRQAVITLLGGTIRPQTSSTPPVVPVAAPPIDAGAATPATLPLAPTTRTLTRAELTSLEISALVALHRIGADLGEDIQLAVKPTGLTITGIVENVERHREVVQALAGITPITLRLRTVADVRRSEATTATTPIVETVAGGAIRLPDRVENEAPLATRLAQMFPDPRQRSASVNGILETADHALARVWAMRKLSERYPAAAVAQLPQAQRALLNALLADHASRLHSSVDALASAVLPILRDDTAIAIPADARSLPALPTIETLFEDIRTIHDRLRGLLLGTSHVADPRALVEQTVNDLTRMQEALKAFESSLARH